MRARATMAIGTRRRRLSAVAFVAIALFGLQALLVGFLAGAHAAPTLLDAFGNVICTAADDGPDPAGGGVPNDHSHLDCCALGCGPSGPTAAPLPALAGVRLERSGAPVPPAVADDTSAGLASHRTPRNTRAPPHAA